MEAQAPAAEEIVKTADVIVIGTGGAGMTAAYVAAKNGASVIAIDKMSYTGGNTLAAGSSMNAADPARQGQLTMEASEMSVIKNMLALEPRCELMAQWQADVRKDIEAYEANGDHYLYDSPALHALQTYVEGDYVGNPELIDLYAKSAGCGDVPGGAGHGLEPHLCGHGRDLAPHARCGAELGRAGRCVRLSAAEGV